MGYKINDELIERIRDTIDIVDVVSRYVNLRKTGSNYVGLCPFHNEKTPSFTVSETKNLFHCFGCGEGGDLITFIMKKENLSFVESIKFLADMYNIPVDISDNSSYSEAKKEKEKIYKINREAGLFYFYNLRKSPKPLRYLKDRNINENIMTKFGLGYASDSWNQIYNYLRSKGFEDKDIEKSGLISRKKDNTGYYDKFVNRVIFPIIDIKDRIIGFGGRVLDDRKPKYLNSPDTPVFEKGKNLFGLNIVHKNSNREKIILVEGYMDVISLYNYGIDYAVASLGTAFTQYQARLLKRYGKNIYICYDSDDAGIKATLKALNILEKEEAEPRVIMLPDNLDPDDFIKKYGLEEFKNLESNTLSSIDYRIYILRQKYSLNRAEEKIKFIKEVAAIIKALKSPVEREIYINRIASETNISKEAIEREVLGNLYKPSITIYKDKYINGKIRNNKNEITPVKTVLESAHLTAEKNLVGLMMKSRSYYDMVKKHINKEDFLNYECKAIADIIYNEYENNPLLAKLDIQTLMSRLEKEDNIDFEIVKEVAELDIVAEDMEKLIRDLIKTINYFKLKMERKLVANRIKQLDYKKDKEKGDVEELKRLCIRLTELDKELKLHI